MDGICSKRLAPFLPELLECLRSWARAFELSDRHLDILGLFSVDPALEVLRAHYPTNASTPLVIKRLYEEGAVVPDQKPLFVYSGSLAALLELETLVLQRVGIACISAYNAYKMAMNLKKV